jgi:WD40 repeat protein
VVPEGSRPGRSHGTTSAETTRIWDAETGMGLAKLGEDNYNMAFSSDGRIVQTTGKDGVFFWDARTGREVKLLSEREKRYIGAIFSPIEDQVAGVRKEGL